MVPPNGRADAARPLAPSAGRCTPPGCFLWSSHAPYPPPCRCLDTHRPTGVMAAPRSATPRWRGKTDPRHSHGPADRHSAPAPLRWPTAPWDVWKPLSATGLDCAAGGGLPPPPPPNPDAHSRPARPAPARWACTTRTTPCALSPGPAPRTRTRPDEQRSSDPLGPYCRPRTSDAAVVRPPHPARGAPSAPPQGGSRAWQRPPTEGRGVQMYRRRNDGSAGDGGTARRVSREVGASKDAVWFLRLEAPIAGIAGAPMIPRGSCAGAPPIVIRRPATRRGRSLGRLRARAPPGASRARQA